jgi:Ca-activated chloride channel homolog
MRGNFLALALIGLAGSTLVRADGLLIPTDRALPPLRLTYQRIDVTIVGQVATTKVEQSYHNGTNRDLEAEYIFPLPAGASVRDFSMWVGGKRYRGEAIDAPKARQTYEDIVRRLQDPGLLEYVGRDLWKVRIYPVPRQGEQKIEITYTSILPVEGGMISYQYLLRNSQSVPTTVKDFTMVVRIQSPDPLGPIYSPSHDVAIDRQGEREAVVSFERNVCKLDKDFRLYFVPKAERIGFSLLAHRDSPGDRGFFLLMLSPSALAKERSAPRDLVLVVDTSSSMEDEKLRQAKAALRHTLDSLGPDDRFALIAFATTPRSFRQGLSEPTAEDLREARSWVEHLKAAGGTDIAAALEAALGFRTEKRTGRTFQVVFLTDGLPTVGLTEKSKIIEMVNQRDNQGIRIYTFGVGDDVDAHLLDLLTETTRGCSTYVRPTEDLEVKVSAFSAKIQRPVRTELELEISGGPRLVEMYPPRLPDLFQGEQLQVLGRYEGHGRAAITLKGHAGDHLFSESFETRFPEMAADYSFIAPIWARRKVGYLLDQIRLNGESAEVKGELIQLAREFSIATPYTSLLVVPESTLSLDPGRNRSSSRRRRTSSASMPFGGGGFGGAGGGIGGMGGGMAGMGMTGRPMGMGGMGGGMGGMGGGMGGMRTSPMGGSVAGQGRGNGGAVAPSPDRELGGANNSGREDKNSGAASAPVAGLASSGKEAIDLAQRLAELKTGTRAETSSTLRAVAGRRFRKVHEAWVDQAFKPSTPILRVRVLGKAYFRILAQHPELSPIFALGNRVTWVSPSGTALVIDNQGQDEVTDATLDRLFARPN